MTIVTQLLSDKKLSRQQEPLVKQDELAEGKDAEEGSPVLVTMRAHARRVNSTTTLCVFVTALLVLSTGIIGGVYLYKQFAQYKLRHFRGWCIVPIPDSQSMQRPSSLKHQGAHHEPLTHTERWESELISDSPYDKFFQEEFDIDIEFEQYERIEVPDFSHGRKGRFIHDFTANKTGIIDLEGHRCFVMPLNRTLVLPPHSLFDLVVKMRDGYYDVDTEIVRETMRVLTPAISDFKSVGYYIAQECATMPTFYLERVTSPVYKRSLEKNNAIFVEFAGHKIAEFNIVNIGAASGTPKQ